VQSQNAIKDLLDCIDNIGYAVSCINGTSQNYIKGSKTVVYFEKQSNYVCLRKLDDQLDLDSTTDVAQFTKQRSERWHRLRDNSRVTGSTLFKALGFGTLKEQQEHYEKVFLHKKPSIPDEVQRLFDYGTENENNALATLLGKIIPVYFPSLVYREDGCELLDLGDSYAVVSGDGSGINADGGTDVAFEFKCPKPGKKRTTDVHYELPVYYSTQVLSQMAAKHCNTCAYVSYTPESSTFISLTFDDEIWNEVWKLATCLLGNSSAKKPTRRGEEIKVIQQNLKDYSRKSQFVAEFPSLRCQPCDCNTVGDVNEVFKQHGSVQSVDTNYTCADLRSPLQSTIRTLQEAYNILRKPAKEVIVTVVSDLDRQTNQSSPHAGHAVPIQYGFSGFSLTMDTARKFITEAVHACSSHGLKVKVIASDGQFLELATLDPSGRPITVCKFMKVLWEKVCKLPKKEKLSAILQSKSPIGSPQNIANALRRKDTPKTPEEPREDDREDQQFDLMKYLPSEIRREMDEETLKIIDKAGKLVTDHNANKEAEDHGNHDTMGIVEELDMITPDYTTAQQAVISLNTESRSTFWKTCSVEEFKSFLQNGSKIHKHFRVDELKAIAGTSEKLLKHQLVAIVSSKFGDGSTVEEKPKTPKSLSSIVEKFIKSWSAEAVNVAYAQMIFPQEYQVWSNKNQFNGPCSFVTGNGEVYSIQQWYAQPSTIDGQLIQPIIDPHHLLVNNRSRCCSKGLKKMGIKPDAWWKVAETEKGTKYGLTLELAKELRDRQSNAFAKTTFSEDVQDILEEMGYSSEADWCRLLRHWYSAVDDAGVPTGTRIKWLLEMRHKLLSHLNVGHFPPPGAYVCDLPMSQFEGFLTNIDRRIQLYCMVENGTYNQRAVSSLDSETFFSGFQVCISIYIDETFSEHDEKI
jgi:hypothetical protein